LSVLRSLGRTRWSKGDYIHHELPFHCHQSCKGIYTRLCTYAALDAS
jgi:hypothetical protein